MKDCYIEKESLPGSGGSANLENQTLRGIHFPCKIVCPDCMGEMWFSAESRELAEKVNSEGIDGIRCPDCMDAQAEKTLALFDRWSGVNPDWLKEQEVS